MRAQNKIKNSDRSPKISVIVLTYNRAKLLPRAIKSVLNQTFSDFELIIINNAATDNTDEVVESFNDKRIVYKKHKENKGPLRGLNTGLDTARGKYIIFLSDDDELLPDALETVVGKFAELSPKGVKILWFDCIDAEIGKYSGWGMRKEGFVSYEDYLCNRIIGDYQMTIDKNIIGDNRFDPNLWGGMPSTLWLKLHRGNKAFYIPKVIGRLYREYGGSRISMPETSLLEHITKIIFTIKSYLKEYGEETKILCPKCYGQRLASMGFYQILNGEKQEGRSNIFTSFKFNFSLNHCFILFLSFILNKNQIKFICLKFFKIKEIIQKF